MKNAALQALKRYIKLSLLIEDRPPPEAPKSAKYGEYLFGSSRTEINPEEVDTPEERQMAREVERFFSGGMRDLKQSTINKLVDVRSKGRYLPMLTVPNHYTSAWRIIGVPRLDFRRLDINVVHDLGSRLYGIDAAKKPSVWNNFKGRPVVSWTVSRTGLHDILADWGSFGDEARPVLVVFKADLGSQRDSFLLNPDKTQDMARNYAYQKEIWQVADVTCRMACVKLDYERAGKIWSQSEVELRTAHVGEVLHKLLAQVEK